MTFREKLVHEKLKSALSNPHLIFLLLTPSSVSPTESTHRMEYAAFISRSRSACHVCLFDSGTTSCCHVKPCPNLHSSVICTLLICVFSCSSCRRFTNVPVLVNNLGLLEQLSYWKVSAPCSAAGYNLTMKKHGSDPAHGRDFMMRFVTKS